STDPDKDVEVLKARIDVKKAELAVARASLEAATGRHGRLGQLAARGAVSTEELAKVKAAVIQAEAQLKVKEAQLRESTVVLQQAQRRSGWDRDPATTTTTARPLSLEQRVRDLEKKVEALQKELERGRLKGKGSLDRPRNP